MEEGLQAEEGENIIRFRVFNVSELTESSRSSPIKVIGGFPWKLEVKRYTYSNDEYLAVCVHCCKTAESVLWCCDSSVDFILEKEKDIKESITKTVSHRFGHSNEYNGYGIAFIKMDSVLDAEQGFIKNNTIVISSRIVLKSRSGEHFRARTKVDLFSSSELSDVALVIGEKTFYVSKQMLSIHSEVFKSMFYGDFKEAKQEEVVIRDVDAEEFSILLKIMYKVGPKLTEKNIDVVLKLADRFDVKFILDEAESYLLASEKPGLDRKLRLSEQYRLALLNEQCLSQYTTCKMLKDLRRSEEYPHLSEETKDLLFEKFAQLCKCSE